MHMDTFGLKIIASDKIFYDGRCRKLTLPAPDGEIGILANHENTVIALSVGDAKMEIEENQWIEMALGEGFAEVVNNRVTVLVETAERPEEIDVRRAEEAKERAQERLRQKQSIQEYYMTQAALSRAMSRLKVSQRKK
jgi:F-type H+-transporting ATPase subunit epsilon